MTGQWWIDLWLAGALILIGIDYAARLHWHADLPWVEVGARVLWPATAAIAVLLIVALVISNHLPNRWRK